MLVGDSPLTSWPTQFETQALMSLAILCSVLSLRALIQVQDSSQTHSCYSFPGTLYPSRHPQIAFWDPAASQTTGLGLSKYCLSLGTNTISSPFCKVCVYIYFVGEWFHHPPIFIGRNLKDILNEPPSLPCITLSQKPLLSNLLPLLQLRPAQLHCTQCASRVI